jgi:hypothetical protein
MRLCFDLTNPYPIGPIPMCLFGGNTTASGLSICGPVCGTVDQTCPATGYQRISVCVPITVTPHATLGTIETFCCGAPTITPGSSPCAGTANGSCSFTISQQLCVRVPVTFGASASTGDPHVECGEVIGEDACTNCGSAGRSNTEIFNNLRSIFNSNKN